jgi:hypothetical protein
MSSGGVTYFEFAPRRSADGKISAVDLFAYTSAEFLSATVRRAVLPIIANESRNFLDKRVTGEQDSTGWTKRWGEIPI